MDIIDLILKRKKTIVIVSLIVLIGGLVSYFSLGKLREPAYSVTTSLVVTRYPGASPVEVEKEVTAVLERVIQRMGSLKNVKSESHFGRSTIYVNVEGHFSGMQLKQIWDDLRQRVQDAQVLLPAGAKPSTVVDHFGRTYGVFLALSGDGFSYSELRQHARFIQKRLKFCKYVAGITLFGMQEEVINLEISREKLAETGINPSEVVSSLRRQNKIIDSGELTSGSEKVQVFYDDTFSSVEDIKKLVIRGKDSGQLVFLRDIVDVKKTTVTPPNPMLRFNMKPAIGIGISTIAGGNTIVMGNDVKSEIKKIMPQLPAGLEINTINFQSKAVKKAISRFLTGLMQAIIIVTAVLLLSLGLRSSVVIVNGLLFNIAAVVIIMLIFGINLQNVSIAALIIALGMMVDDSVVVSDNILVSLQQGDVSHDQAGKQAVKATGFAQFIATFIVIASFLPIYLAKSATGVFCKSLFLVAAIALAVSWLQAMTVVPVMGSYLLKVKKKETDPFSGRFYRSYRNILKLGLRHRWLVIGIMILLLFIFSYFFGFVKQDFFPFSNRPQFQVNYWRPAGSSIDRTSEDLKQIEKHILSLKGVESVATSVGSGPPRFLLGFSPQQFDPSYGCIIVNTDTRKDALRLMKKVNDYLVSNFPDANPVVSGFPMGGAPQMKIEARFFGPDPEVLRNLANQAKAIMKESKAVNVRDNWRQKVKTWSPEYSQVRGNLTGISREDIGQSLRFFTNGFPIGIYRDGEDKVPILLRFPKGEKSNNGNLDMIPVWGQQEKQSVPLGVVANNAAPRLKNSVIHRLHRLRYISALSNPPPTETSVSFRKKLLKKFKNRINLPPGYQLKWGGAYKMMQTSNKSVNEQLPVAMVLIAVALIVLFNGMLRPVMIFLTLPLSIVGVVIGLLTFRKPFDFMANLGFYCLMGIMVRNGVILILEIDKLIKEGSNPYEAVLRGSVTRIRPVLITAFCTSLGMIPLISDVLFGSMAVTIVGGLIFATIITLVYLPVLYALLRGVHR